MRPRWFRKVLIFWGVIGCGAGFAREDARLPGAGLGMADSCVSGMKKPAGALLKRSAGAGGVRTDVPR